MSTQVPVTFTTAQSTAVIAMGVISGCVPALQPILLGALLDNGQLDATQIGHAATAEALGMAVAATLAAMLLQPNRLRLIAGIALSAALLANSLTSLASGTAIVLLRGANGLCSGTLLWVLLGLMARSPHPARTSAIYVTSQAAASFLFSLMISNWLLAAVGATGGYLLFGAVDLLLLFAVFAMPHAYPPVGDTQGARTLPPRQGLIGLIGVGLFLSAIMGFWVYVLPLGTELGYPAADLNSAVSMAIGAQILAGLCAIAMASRLGAFAACLGGSLVVVATLAGFLALPSVAMLYVSLILFSFVWMFVPPFQMPLLIELDPSLCSVMYIATAQLLGVAIGPILAAELITPDSTVMAANSSIAVMLVSIGLLVAARLSGSAAVAPAAPVASAE